MTRSLRSQLVAAGATWLELPVLHPADPFLETAGEDIRRRMFVTEGRTGDRLALRPDFTIPVCLHHLSATDRQSRYAYEGLVFRRHEEGPRGLGGERHEAGYEDIGDPALALSDARVLCLALDCLAGRLSGSLSVRMGDIGLFMAMLSALDLPMPWQLRLRRAFGAPARMDENLSRLATPPEMPVAAFAPRLLDAANKGSRTDLVAAIGTVLGEHGFLPGAGRSAEEIADRFLDRRALAETRIEPSVLAVLRSWLALETPLGNSVESIAEFANRSGLEIGGALSLFQARRDAILTAAPEADIVFSGGFGRPLDYYTGMVFDIFAPGSGQLVAGGGRYDRLMEMLGSPGPVPAVGFSIRLDRLSGTAEADR